MTTTSAAEDRRFRIISAAVLAAAAFLYAAARAAHEPAWPTDFDQVWHAARALLAGRDPYNEVGPGKPFEWLWPLYYPLPAVLFATPLAWLPVAIARVAFSTISGAILGWVLSARILFLWPLALSAAWLIAVSRTQWSPMVLAVMYAPALAMVATAKPNIGLAALAPHTSRRAFAMAAGSSAVAIVLAFAADPSWFASWRAAIAESPHVTAPVVRPFGFLLLLSLIRWRRADARLVLVMACLPHTPSLYDLLPLFFICRNLREALALALLTHGLFWFNIFFGTGDTFERYAEWLGRAEVFIVYLPVVVAVLARPNRWDDAPPATNPRGWRTAVPSNRIDATLSLMLMVVGFMLVWLPLVTYR